MARSNSNTTLKYLGAATAAVIGGIAIGMIVGSARSPRMDTPPVTQTDAPPLSTPPPAVKPPVVRPVASGGNYTAPGAPRIQIHEDPTPVLRRVEKTDTKPVDTEANQEVPPPPPLSETPTPVTVPSPETGSDVRDPAVKTTTPPSAVKPAPDKPVPDKTVSPPANPNPDRTSKPADPEATQESPGKAQFRVQTGAYTDESNARSIADQLRDQGYSPSTRSERQGDHLIYKVQIGAYRSRAGASKAAEDLQKKGFTTFVSPIGP